MNDESKKLTAVGMSRGPGGWRTRGAEIRSFLVDGRRDAAVGPGRVGAAGRGIDAAESTPSVWTTGVQILQPSHRFPVPTGASPPR